MCGLSGDENRDNKVSLASHSPASGDNQLALPKGTGGFPNLLFCFLQKLLTLTCLVRPHCFEEKTFHTALLSKTKQVKMVSKQTGFLKYQFETSYGLFLYLRQEGYL